MRDHTTTCIDQRHDMFGADEEDCLDCRRLWDEGPLGVPPLVTVTTAKPKSRLKRALVEIVSGTLYGVQWAWANAFNIALVIGCTVWTGYWATAWIYLVIDRSGP